MSITQTGPTPISWQVARVTIANAVIKTLPSTTVTLSATPPTGYRAKPLALSLLMHFVTGYTGLDTTYAALQAIVGGGNTAIYPILVNDNSTTPVIDQFTNAFGTGDLLVDVQPVSLFIVPGYALNNNNSTAGAGPSAWDSQPIKIQLDNNGSTSDLGGGNAGNTLTFTLYYVLEQLF